MKSLLLQHRSFFGLFFCWLLCSAFLLSQIQTGDAIFFLNANRSPFWDHFFKLGTQLSEEIAFTALTLLLFLFWRIRDGILMGITGGVVLLVSNLLKAYFAHQRPYVYLTIAGLMDQLQPLEDVRLLVGKTSFPSGHTTGAFALYGLLTLLWRKHWFWGLVFFSLALIVGISRMYLIQHFLKDVFAGSLLGVFLAILIYRLQQYLPDDPTKWWNQSLVAIIRKKFKVGQPSK